MEKKLFLFIVILLAGWVLFKITSSPENDLINEILYFKENQPSNRNITPIVNQYIKQKAKRKDVISLLREQGFSIIEYLYVPAFVVRPEGGGRDMKIYLDIDRNSFLPKIASVNHFIYAKRSFGRGWLLESARVIVEFENSVAIGIEGKIGLDK